MPKHIKYQSLIILAALSTVACKMPSMMSNQKGRNIPAFYNKPADSINSANVGCNLFFKDPYLISLIDSALLKNQELNIVLAEIEISKNEIRAKKGEYLPFIGLKTATGIDKTARYTTTGASIASTQIVPGKEISEPVPDYLIGLYASWEVDIWHKLRNARKSAINKYLASVEGKNFLITNLIAEMARSYYELLALDNELVILKQNIDIQTNALEFVKLQKSASRVTELAVKKFEAEVLKTRSIEYDIRQKITETENRINFLLARYPQHIYRGSDLFSNVILPMIHEGIPSQLLANRPDIRQAELTLAAAKLQAKAARAEFYPSIRLTASNGFQAFNPAYLIKSPESLLYTLAGDLVAPLVNRNAIKANYRTAKAKQIQAVYNYERSIVNAFTEVINELSKIDNLQKKYILQTDEVYALTTSVTISNDLFKSARADYMEVLMTQRDALNAKFELIETRKNQMNATIEVYRSLGGGWK